MSVVVVARYRENLNWLKKINGRIIVYNKGPRDYDFDQKWEVIDLPNVGQCWGSFMTYILTNYNDYPKTTIFLTGCCMSTSQKREATQKVLKDIQNGKSSSIDFKTDKNIERFEIKNWKSSTPENQKASYFTSSQYKDLGTWWKKHFPNKTLYSFVHYLSVFAVSREQLRSIPIQTYQTLHDELQRSPLQEEAHFLERVSSSIWFEKDVKRRQLPLKIVFVLLTVVVVILVKIFVFGRTQRRLMLK